MADDIEYKDLSPMQRRALNPMHESAPNEKKKSKKHNNPRNDAGFVQGFRDFTGFPIEDDDFYATLNSYGFYGNNKLDTDSPNTHSSDTTTVLQYYNTHLKKTPIDTRYDVKHLDLAKVAQDYKNSELFFIQNYAETSAERIKQKSHRILNDPVRTFQSQTLIDIQNRFNRLRNDKALLPLTKVKEYDEMQLTVSMLLLERLTDILDYQEMQLYYNKLETKPLGKNFYAEMTLVDGAMPTKLDFKDKTNNKNIPTAAIIKGQPNHSLLSLNVIFDSGTSIELATNEPTSSLDTTIKLINPPQPYTIQSEKFFLDSLNIRALGADASVRILGLF